MVHISCDICGKQLEPGQSHHVVKIEVFAAEEPVELTEDDLDADPLDEVNELLEEFGDDPEDLEPTTQQFRYELCGDCRRRFARDPLGKDNVMKFDFSEN